MLKSPRASFPSSLLRAFFQSRQFSSIKRQAGWESVVGLEVHAQISSRAKLFSAAGTQFGAPVNTLVANLDAAVPGTLPVLNKECVEAAALTAMALSCEINPVSWFDRKHYFYADLPAGYQITQQRKAIANKGEIKFVVYSPAVHKEPYERKCRIRQLQLEQDSGKSLHVEGGNRSLIDLNRAGVALMEIVFEPDLKDGEEAGALVKELCLILEKLETCSCRMEEGALRVDANISVNRKGMPMGTRAEVKNLSSIRSLVNAIEFEVERQIQELEKGSIIVNETRSYDAETKQTVPMRDKEEKQDYRFMPEPNLPPVKVIYDPASTDPDAVNIAKLRGRLRELPEVTRKRLMKSFGVKMETALLITSTPGFLKYFESVMKSLDPKLGMKAANFISVEVLESINKDNLTLDDFSVRPDCLAEIISLLDEGVVNFLKATEILQLLLNNDQRSPRKIVEDENWGLVSDSKEIQKICQAVLQENPNLVSQYKSKSKKQKYVNQLIGKAKAKTGGKYDMKQVSEIIEKLLRENIEDKESP